MKLVDSLKFRAFDLIIHGSINQARVGGRNRMETANLIDEDVKENF